MMISGCFNDRLINSAVEGIFWVHCNFGTRKLTNGYVVRGCLAMKCHIQTLADDAVLD